MRLFAEFTDTEREDRNLIVLTKRAFGGGAFAEAFAGAFAEAFGGLGDGILERRLRGMALGAEALP